MELAAQSERQVAVFSEWLIEQTERTDNVGKFAQLAWADYTSGCARWYPGAIEWRDHFIARHADKTDEIFPLLSAAFLAYADDRVVKTA